MLTVNDQVALAISVLALLALVLSMSLKRKTPYQGLRKHPTWLALKAIVHGSAEKGEQLWLGVGDTLIDSASISGAQGLNLQRTVARRSIFNDHPALTLSGGGSLALMSRMLAHGAYEQAVAPELFRNNMATLAGPGSPAYLAGLLPEIVRPTGGGLVLSGHSRPEIFLAVDQADRKGMPVVASSDSISAQAAFFASPALTTLGEDYFSAGAALEEEPGSGHAVRSLDWLRVAVALGLVIGAVLKLAGVLP